MSAWAHRRMGAWVGWQSGGPAAVKPPPGLHGCMRSRKHGSMGTWGHGGMAAGVSIDGCLQASAYARRRKHGKRQTLFVLLIHTKMIIAICSATVLQLVLALLQYNCASHSDLVLPRRMSAWLVTNWCQLHYTNQQILHTSFCTYLLPRAASLRMTPAEARALLLLCAACESGARRYCSQQQGVRAESRQVRCCSCAQLASPVQGGTRGGTAAKNRHTGGGGAVQTRMSQRLCTATCLIVERSAIGTHGE